MKKMQHIEEIKDYWNLRANGFSLAVEEELRTESGKEWEEIFRKTITKEKQEIFINKVVEFYVVKKEVSPL